MTAKYVISFILLLPSVIFAQNSSPDTIPASSSLLKTTGEYVLQTTVDTAKTLLINEFMARNSDLVRDEAGDDDDWFEIYNYGDEDILLNQLYFTDDPGEPAKWKIDTSMQIFIKAGEHLLFWADEEQEEGFLHTNFKISGDGEYLGIYDKDGGLIDELFFGAQTINVSYGRYPDGGEDFGFLSQCTPGAANIYIAGENILPAISASQKGGYKKTGFDLKFDGIVEGAEVRYTTDCTIPDKNSTLYEGEINIEETVVIRARQVKSGYLDGPVLTTTFFFETNTFDNPTLSLVANPLDLYGSTGLISTSSKTREVSASFEFIDDGIATFSSGAGIQLHSVKAVKPYSMRLYARSRYGNEWFEHPFFEDEAPDHFKRLILRNSGNDNINNAKYGAHFRDPLAAEIALASNEDPMVSESRPVNIYINGKYYGIFNMRERIDEHYIESHTGVTEDFDLLERAFGYPKNRNAIVGSFSNWDKLLSFVDTTGDMSDDDDFAYVESQVDIKNFTDYWITEVFIGNYDWLSNNIKFWRPEDGKWRWIYWDLDHGLGLPYASYGDVNWNTLQWSLTFSDRAWTTGFNNILIRNLLKNDAYREYFIKRFNHLLNTSFAFENTYPLYEKMLRSYENDIVKHAEKYTRDLQKWEELHDTIRAYLKKRPDRMMTFVKDFFELEAALPVKLAVEPEHAGSLWFGPETSTKTQLNGQYFSNMNYELDALPADKFKLYKITMNKNSVDPGNVYLTEGLEIQATFIPSDQHIPVQLTEVFYHNREKYDTGDWIELLNYGPDTLWMDRYAIRDKFGELLFSFGKKDFIPPGAYYIIAEDKDAFRAVFPLNIPQTGQLLKDLDRNISYCLFGPGSDTLFLAEIKKPEGLPDLSGDGHSIELKKVMNEVDSAFNWEASVYPYGSPGLPNHLEYKFHPPFGKDSTFIGGKQNLNLESSTFYFDLDDHAFAELYIKEITGPGIFKNNFENISENSYLTSGTISYQPGDDPQELSSITYNLIDRSGSRSKDYTLLFTPPSLSGTIESKTFNCYPLPANDRLYLDLPLNVEGDVLLRFIDINGRVIENFTYSAHQKIADIDVSELPQGMYILQLVHKKTTYNSRVEISR